MGWVIYGLAVLGGIFGSWASDAVGVTVGAALGLLAGLVIDVRRRFNELDRRLTRLEEASAWEPGRRVLPVEQPSTPPLSAPPPVSAATPTTPSIGVSETTEEALDHFEPEPPKASPINQVVGHAREFFLGGNTVVRVGILVVLVGITLLVKWAADRDYFPIELRMISAALIGLALVVVGYRARKTRPGFGQIPPPLAPLVLTESQRPSC